ncbi:MAG: hypothetical protein ACPGO5_01090 [Patescibacteria group bacterium]
MSSYWEKLLDVVDKTREKIFFFSANRTYVVMSLEQYESLLGQSKQSHDLSEEELLEKINRDIAMWKSKVAEDESDLTANELKVEAETEDETGDDEEFQIEPVNIK